MTDLDKALAAARESLANEGHRSADALRDLIAALDAARGEPVLEIVGGEDGWRGTWEHLPLSEFDVGTKLYAAPPAAAVQFSEADIATAVSLARKDERKKLAAAGPNKYALIGHGFTIEPYFELCADDEALLAAVTEMVGTEPADDGEDMAASITEELLATGSHSAEHGSMWLHRLAPQPAAAGVPAANVTPMRQPRADLARLVESINAAVYANGDGLSVTEAIGALELAKLELLKEQEQ